MSEELHTRMMRRALDEAHAAAAIGEVPVGAVVFRGEDVLGVGHNVRESEGDPTGHAEIVALRRAAVAVGSWRLDRCEMAV
ncbi:MAG: nucleoside deaminase, partial [Phycisphaeraceae bacterium]